MQIDTKELGVLADMLNEQRITALERELAKANEETAFWRSRCEQLEQMQVASTVENLVLKNYIMLSAEKMKVFVARLGKMEQWAFLRTFVEWSLPDELEREERAMLNKVMPLPSGFTQQVNISQAHDVIAEGGTKIIHSGG